MEVVMSGLQKRALRHSWRMDDVTGGGEGVDGSANALAKVGYYCYFQPFQAGLTSRCSFHHQKDSIVVGDYVTHHLDDAKMMELEVGFHLVFGVLMIPRYYGLPFLVCLHHLGYQRQAIHHHH